MNRFSRSKRIVAAAFAAMAAGSLAAFAADVFVGTPPFNPPPSQQVTIDLLVDVGGEVLGSYFFDFLYDPAVVHVVSIGGGATVEFSGPPTTDPATFSSGVTPLAAAQGSVTSPAGFVSVGTVTLTAVGLPADATDLDLDVTSLFNAQADALPSTVFPSSLLIALPEVPPNLVFSSVTTLTWAPALDVTHYNVYRGTLPASGGLTFNHTCLAPDLVATVATDTATPTSGQGFYYLVGAERNGVEGPLGVTSQGQVRPNFFSCSSAASSGVNASELRTVMVDGSSVVGLPGWSVRAARRASATETSATGVRVASDALAPRTTGDVNGDGRLDDADAEAILKAVVGVRPLAPAEEIEADADGDGRVDVADAQRLRQFLTAGRAGEARRARGGLPVVLGSADCSAVDFMAGLSLVRLRCLPEGYTAFELLGDLADDSATVQRFDSVRNGYRTARMVAGQPEGDDFPVLAVESFLLDLSAEHPGFRPGRVGRQTVLEPGSAFERERRQLASPVE